MTGPVHKLGEMLRTAREAKGVDLARVERETKIRERYLSALENGEYDDLPGAVYTRGFLRNYGAYLGLDAEELIDLYRIETSSAPAERQALPAPPRPLATRRTRAFVITPSAIVAAILTVLVGGFFAYLGYQLINYARTPDLRIIDPPGNVNGYDQLEITIRGETEPNAKVTVNNLAENPTVMADAEGRFEVTVRLVPGSNVIDLTADDPTLSRTSETVSRTIVVVTAEVSPSAAPEPVATELSEPASGATVQGPVTVAGSATPGATVTVTAALQRPPTPTFTIVDPSGTTVQPAITPPTAPAPTSVVADASGMFSTTVALPAGEWTLTAASESSEATANVVVAPGPGLASELTISGGQSYLDLYEDGIRVPDISGRNAQDGAVVQLAASEELRIRAGNAAVVRVRVNGIDLGTMGGPGAVVEWRITRDGG